MLIEHIGQPLHDSDDKQFVDDPLPPVSERGNEARRQHATWERSGQPSDAIADLANLTNG